MESSGAKKLQTEEILVAAGYAAVLLWVNWYVARDFFTAHTAWMNSMHGFWTAIAKHAGTGWWKPEWWPYWDCGIPFEATYAPLVPGLTAAWSALAHMPQEQAFGCVTGLFYLLGPVTLFLMAWGLTRKPGASFFAALFYSLTTPTQLIVPDGTLHLTDFWQARRLFLASVWDETPHMSAVALLPLAILFLALSIESRRRIWYAAAALTIALMTAASAFGPVIAAMAAACLILVPRREERMRPFLLVAGIGAYAYLAAMAWVPPSVLRAIHESSAASTEEGWNAGSFTAAALLILGWTILWSLLPRWTKDWRAQSAVLFAWLTFGITFTGEILNRRLLPQPGRYRLELELAIALVVAFGAARLLERVPLAVRRAVILLMLAVAAEQIVVYRKFEKSYLFSRDQQKTVEYRAAVWAERNLPGTRVFFPGSMSQWADNFAPIPQFSGGSWSMATNQSQQRAEADIVFGSGPQVRTISLTWLKAYGVGAIAVSAPNSQEYWRPFADPAKFDLLPALWSDSGVTIHRVPLRSTSLAHVVPPGAIVRHAPRNPEDAGEAARYVAALDDASLPLAELSWDGVNGLRIHTMAAPSQALSIQVSYHPGWRATVNGRPRPVYKDGLGLMWLRPECNGACEVMLRYTGGWGLWTARVVSYAAIAGLLIVLGGACLGLRGSVLRRRAS